MKLAAVTGRTGRTSATHYIAQSWQRVEGDAALVGRNGSGPFQSPENRLLDALEPVTLARTLAECLDAGIGMAALEMTPGFLDQG